MSAFEQAFRVIVGHEGGYTALRSDPGNWTGGGVGLGQCKGTKYGISAASYPALDIANLTLGAAQAIYRRDYWDKVRGADLPPSLALLVFDAAINNGVARAARWLQQAAGANADGKLGEVTLAAVRKADALTLQVEFQTQRMVFMASLPTWKTFGLGWARRLCRLPYEAVAMGSL